jgi:signal transduction histidine kinase
MEGAASGATPQQRGRGILEAPAAGTRPAVRLVEIALLAGLYVLAGRYGLSLDPIAGFATLVWAPTGLAIAALLLRGYGLWPGVAIGALLANVWAGASVPIALGISLGNTLEAVVAVYALNHFPGFRRSLDRVRDVLAFIALAAVLSTMISATIGVFTLSVGEVLPTAELARAWQTWWLGDLVGALVIAPMFLVWGSTHPSLPEPRRLLETLLLAATVIGSSALIFLAPPESPRERLEPYMLFPPLIWAALRFGKRGAVSSTFGASVIAVLATASGFGPFTEPRLYDSLLGLQIFMGIIGATFLLLGAAVSERRRAAQDLEVARERAESANRTKAEFLAVVSHELRTPLNAISGYGELLTMELAGPITQHQRDSIERIRRNARHLLTLIDEVLSFTRNEAGRLKFTAAAVSVAEALSEAEALVGSELQRKQLTVDYAIADPNMQVRADPEKLRQILLNLVGNAIKFTPRGGRITLGAERDGSLGRLWVRDTGIGIPTDKLARVFEPFYQVEGGSTRRYPGFGLGLAIARDFARAMDGDMKIESADGAGATVSVLLPAIERRSAVITPVQPATQVQGDPVSSETPAG